MGWDRRISRRYAALIGLLDVWRESHRGSGRNHSENAIHLSPMRGATRKASECCGAPSLRCGVNGTAGTGEEATRAQVRGSCGKTMLEVSWEVETFQGSV